MLRAVPGVKRCDGRRCKLSPEHTTTRGDRAVTGKTGSGKGLVLWSLAAAVAGAERQILVRIGRGGNLIGERELRYQVARKDDHPLAQAPELLDVLGVVSESRWLRTVWITVVRMTCATRSRRCCCTRAAT